VNRRLDRELRYWVVVPLPFTIQEASKPRNLGGEIHNDDLHVYLKFKPQDLLARLKRLLARGDEHVALKSELLDAVDQLAELGTPA